MRSLLAFLADVLLGPACPHGCGHRARGPRSQTRHCSHDHAGDQPVLGCSCHPHYADPGIHAPGGAA